ncbi:CopG family transcriptional regulator [Nocardia cyriacigeorgica]|uniref:CopG family transcriptional regulator n=1 Tax=Nocardia cyriacigeorgica TaxID=135487 RepID=A0A5R8PHM6_9NOCA|nr:ribbon-helix-helix protein, CopG family [Nocardia cyriacigeorgica]TLG14321.1 CopG family transcriptional regulator [Nocardia cyriacigeorgica]
MSRTGMGGEPIEDAERKRLTVADYERMADDYAANPVRDTEVVGPVEIGTTVLRKGRPAGIRKGKTPGQSVRLPEALRERLATQAEREKATPSEVIRRAVAEYLDRHSA